MEIYFKNLVNVLCYFCVCLGKNPILDGEVSTIEIQRPPEDRAIRPTYNMGISIVGGCDTPLICIVIQEIIKGGIVDQDGRLLPGDQILEVLKLDLWLPIKTEGL